MHLKDILLAVAAVIAIAPFLAAFLGRRKQAARIAGLDERLAVAEWIGLDLTRKLDFIVSALEAAGLEAEAPEAGAVSLWAA